MIKSISYEEKEIQENILKLFSDLDYYELDPCYSTGVFYKRGLNFSWLDVLPWSYHNDEWSGNDSTFYSIF